MLSDTQKKCAWWHACVIDNLKLLSIGAMAPALTAECNCFITSILFHVHALGLDESGFSFGASCRYERARAGVPKTGPLDHAAMHAVAESMAAGCVVIG
jgi:hypothetical protein